MPSFISKILRFTLKVVLTVFGLVFALSLLAAALVVVVLSLIKALLTGQKPRPAMVFGRFQKFSPQGMWPGAAAPADKPGEIVDVEVREVRDDKRVP